jgi:hypothetical protein
MQRQNSLGAVCFGWSRDVQVVGLGCSGVTATLGEPEPVRIEGADEPVAPQRAPKSLRRKRGPQTRVDRKRL